MRANKASFATLIFVARGFLRARFGFLSVISWISVTGLTLGVAALILVTSVMNGFERELRTRVLGVVPHGLIYVNEPLEGWRDVVADLEGLDGVMGAAPYIAGQGLLLYNGVSQGVQIQGIFPEEEPRVSILPDYMQLGSLSDLKPSQFGVVLGARLVQDMQLQLGDSMTLILPSASMGIGGVHPRIRRLKLVGIYVLGSELEDSLAYVHHADASALFRQPGVRTIQLRTSELFQSDEITHAAALRVSSKWTADTVQYGDWQRTHGTLFQAIQLEQRLVALMLFVIILVAAFNVLATLAMKVETDRASVAILRTLGATRGFILKLFLLQGLLIGLMGTLVGAVLGLVAAATVEAFFAWLASAFGVQLLEAYFINYLPSQIHWDEVLFTCAGAIFMSALAGLYPAWLAVSIDPAQVLRHE